MRNKIILLILLLLPFNVMAATGKITASASSTKVTLNNNVTVTVKVSSTDNIGSWKFNISYDKKKLSLTSGDTTVVGYGDGTYKSKSYTYKFKAIATGNASITIDNAKIADYETEEYISTSVSNLTLSIKEPVIINYSSDNNLKSLSVDEFKISPEFNKSTLDYSVTTNADTTKIKINASANDTKAKVSGAGEKEVKEGNNAFEIVVTAENGTSKTYKINVVVPEKDPIKYTFNGEEYSILRKLPEKVPVNFKTSTIKFNDEDIMCLQNENLNLTLIYLRDSKNNENFYIYNESNNTINLYNEITTNEISIYLDKPIKELNNLVKTTIKINEQEVEAYQIQKGSKDYIIYGKDVSTGKGAYYVYDKNERTISLFNEDDVNYLLNKNNIYKTLTYAFGALVFIEFIIIILFSNTKKKMNKFLTKMEKKK